MPRTPSGPDADRTGSAKQGGGGERRLSLLAGGTVDDGANIHTDSESTK